MDPRACGLPNFGTNRRNVGGRESARTHQDDQHQFRTRLRRRNLSKHGKDERAQTGDLARYHAPWPKRICTAPGILAVEMSGSRTKVSLPDTSDRSGPECTETFGGSVNVTLWQELPAAIGPARLSPASANRKRGRSMPRVFGSIGGGFDRD